MTYIETLKEMIKDAEASLKLAECIRMPFDAVPSHNRIAALIAAIADMERMEWLEKEARYIEKVGDGEVIYDLYEGPWEVREAIDAAMKGDK